MISFLSIIMYVVSSYMDTKESAELAPLKWLDFLFDVLFLVDYLFYLYLADDRIMHILSEPSSEAYPHMLQDQLRLQTFFQCYLYSLF